MNEVILGIIYIALSPLWLILLIVVLVPFIDYLRKLIKDRKYKIKGTSNKNTAKYATLTCVFGLAIIAVLLVPNLIYTAQVTRIKAEQKKACPCGQTLKHGCVPCSGSVPTKSKTTKSNSEYISYYDSSETNE